MDSELQRIVLFTLLILLSTCTYNVAAHAGNVTNLVNLQARPRDLYIELHKNNSLVFTTSHPIVADVSIYFDPPTYNDTIRLSSNPIILHRTTTNQSQSTRVVCTGLQVTKIVLQPTNCSLLSVDGDIDTSLEQLSFDGQGECPLNMSTAYTRVHVVHSMALQLIIDIVGWVYFVAWSVSFYPQIVLNIKRKSVLGLNFDFLALNLIGFICYSVYNCALYYSPEVQHAGQRVSYACRCILSAIVVFIVLCAILLFAKTIQVLLFVQLISYVKLAVTLIKYVPQAYFNYRRKSTKGWSIGNVLLDFTGGSMSILQMFLIAYNADDWVEMFGDFTKFGLGFISICFDVLFMLQHYVLYSPHKVRLRDSAHDKSNSHLSDDDDRVPIVIDNDDNDEVINDEIIDDLNQSAQNRDGETHRRSHAQQQYVDYGATGHSM